MADSSATAGGADDGLKEELATLRVLRASLESMRQLVQEVQKDVETSMMNYDAIGELGKRWQTAMREARKLDEQESAALAKSTTT